MSINVNQLFIQTKYADIQLCHKQMPRHEQVITRILIETNLGNFL